MAYESIKDIKSLDLCNNFRQKGSAGSAVCYNKVSCYRTLEVFTLTKRKLDE